MAGDEHERNATRLAIIRCQAHLAAAQGSGRLLLDPIKHQHAGWMCREVLGHSGEWPVDKMSRWLGFVQGYLWAADLMDLNAEIEACRGLFKGKPGEQ